MSPKIIKIAIAILVCLLAFLALASVSVKTETGTTVQYLNQFWFEIDEICFSKDNKCTTKTKTDINKFEDKENGVVCYIATTGYRNSYYDPTSSISCLKMDTPKQ